MLRNGKYVKEKKLRIGIYSQDFDLIEEAEDGRLHRRGYVNDPGVGSDDRR